MAKPRAFKRAIHIIASLFVPLIIIELLILTAFQMAIGGLGENVKKLGRQGGVGGIMGEEEKQAEEPKKEECEEEKKEEPKPEEEKPAEESKPEEAKE